MWLDILNSASSTHKLNTTLRGREKAKITTQTGEGYFFLSSLKNDHL